MRSPTSRCGTPCSRAGCCAPATRPAWSRRCGRCSRFTRRCGSPSPTPSRPCRAPPRPGQLGRGGVFDDGRQRPVEVAEDPGCRGIAPKRCERIAGVEGHDVTVQAVPPALASVFNRSRSNERTFCRRRAERLPVTRRESRRLADFSRAIRFDEDTGQPPTAPTRSAGSGSACAGARVLNERSGYTFNADAS